MNSAVGESRSSGSSIGEHSPLLPTAPTLSTDLIKKLDQPKEQPVIAAPVATPMSTEPVYTPPEPPQSPSDCSDAKSCIYLHESGNDPTRLNSIGCLGLGQSCPASKLLAVCPTMDYDCEDNWFTQYAINRYGSWEAAWAFWQQNHWW